MLRVLRNVLGACLCGIGAIIVITGMGLVDDPRIRDQIMDGWKKMSDVAKEWNDAKPSNG